MKGKVITFSGITIVLFAIIFGMYIRYIHVSSYGVFIESYDHGTMTVDSDDTVGTDTKFRVMCKKGEKITININPERTEKTYYNLDKLTVNGVDVTDEVSMHQYKTTVKSKLTVIATFKKGKRPSSDTESTTVDVSAPTVDRPADNEYLGSYAAYDIKDPSVFYDEESGYYYCFGSDNVVIRSTDLVNWFGRTTYFAHPENASSNAIMTFSQFDSVKEWGKTHGYGKEETTSDKNNDRTPLSPEIVKVGDTYYLYFALSKINGANESAIFCVKTDNLADAIETKEWEDVGLVISSCSGDKANAVHPSVLVDGDSMYMAYGGSYGADKINGEIYLVALDVKTGLLKDNAVGDKISTSHGEEVFRTGTLIADPGRVPALSKNSGSLVCGADIVFNEATDYYYLFVTYGDESTNYNIRVARSQNIAGPYTDYNGQSMADFSKNMYDVGYMLMGGYNFTNSSSGRVSYTDVGRASIGSPNIIKSSDGTWFIASQSQLYYKVDSLITTGSAIAEEHSLMLNSAPALEVRELLWSENGWPMAMPEMYSGEKADNSVKLKELYGHWDIIVFDTGASDEDYKTVARSQSEIVSILSNAVISQTDINKKKDINTGATFTKSGKGYVVTIDGVQYTVYPRTVWDWELKEGSIVIMGIGSDGSTIWGKKNLSATMGLYTDAFYYLYDKCEGENADTIAQRIEKMKTNPSQVLIDKYSNWMLKKLTATE